MGQPPPPLFPLLIRPTHSEMVCVTPKVGEGAGPRVRPTIGTMAGAGVGVRALSSYNAYGARIGVRVCSERAFGRDAWCAFFFFLELAPAPALPPFPPTRLCGSRSGGEGGVGGRRSLPRWK